MEVRFTETAMADLSYWKDPFHGIGKPEPLKFKLSGLWSRRINREHRIVYQVEKDVCYIISFSSS